MPQNSKEVDEVELMDFRITHTKTECCLEYSITPRRLNVILSKGDPYTKYKINCDDAVAMTKTHTQTYVANHFGVSKYYLQKQLF
jgi:hypothetical protein